MTRTTAHAAGVWKQLPQNARLQLIAVLAGMTKSLLAKLEEHHDENH